jgi:alcohol dehydrogenase class IV
MIQIKPPIHCGTIDNQLLDQLIVGSKIAVVCSNSVWNKTDISDVIERLGQKYETRVFRHLRPNAPFADLQKVIDEFDDGKPDTIIGIGGGSVIDACKALSVCFAGDSISDLFYKVKPLPAQSIPVIAVPTTAGTGAELSFGAIIFDDINNVKGGLRGTTLQPNAVIVDVDLYKTAPKKILAEVGFDCLTHALETYLSVKSNSLTRYQSVAAIRTVFDFLPTAVGGDLESLKQMAIASATMGINLAYSSTCLPHRIQYVIGPLTETSHAQGLIALYKGWLPLVGADKAVSGLADLERDLKADFDIIDRIQHLKQELDIDYSISDLGVKPEQVEQIAASVKGSVEFDPCYQDINTITKLLEGSL